MRKKTIIIGFLCLLALCSLVLGSCSQKCLTCDGTGKCSACRGTGRVAGLTQYEQCTVCRPMGSGKCWQCDGTGKW